MSSESRPDMDLVIEQQIELIAKFQEVLKEKISQRELLNAGELPDKLTKLCEGLKMLKEAQMSQEVTKNMLGQSF